MGEVDQSVEAGGELGKESLHWVPANISQIHVTAKRCLSKLLCLSNSSQWKNDINCDVGAMDKNFGRWRSAGKLIMYVEVFEW